MPGIDQTGPRPLPGLRYPIRHSIRLLAPRRSTDPTYPFVTRPRGDPNRGDRTECRPEQPRPPSWLAQPVPARGRDRGQPSTPIQQRGQQQREKQHEHQQHHPEPARASLHGIIGTFSERHDPAGSVRVCGGLVRDGRRYCQCAFLRIPWPDPSGPCPCVGGTARPSRCRLAGRPRKREPLGLQPSRARRRQAMCGADDADQSGGPTEGRLASGSVE